MSLLLFLFMFFTPSLLPFLFATNNLKYFCQIFEMQLPRYWKNIGKSKTLVVMFVGEWEGVWESA
jgi:hypothetical protein